MTAEFSAKLVMMANQIAVAFERQHGDAAKETASHIRAFWPRPMREAIMRHLAAGQGGLSPAAQEAVAALAAADPRDSRS